VSEFDSLRMFRRPVFRPTRDDQFDDSIFELVDFEAEREEPPSREGLPPGFRMRHDAHYVEQLASGPGGPPLRQIAIKDIDVPRGTDPGGLAPLTDSISKVGLLQPLLVRSRGSRFELIAGTRRLAAAVAAGFTTIPCLVHDADDRRVRALAEADNLRSEQERSGIAEQEAQGRAVAMAAKEVGAGMDTIRSCLGLVSDHGRTLRERVALELARGEARRAAWLARACSVLVTAPTPTRTALDPSVVLERVAATWRPDSRFAGVTLSIERGNGPNVSADEPLLRLALIGAIGGVVALSREADHDALVLGASVRLAPGLVYFDVAQTRVPVPAAKLARLLEGALTDASVSADAVIGLVLARRVVALHDGRLDATTIDPAGCRISLGFPNNE
jgi:ParB/Sulfiredoxin domain